MASRVADASRLAAAILAGAFSRRAVRPQQAEARGALPGDELLRDPKLRLTHGVTIKGPAAEIWRWLIQMGCRRAGWYSYDGLDNGGVPSSDRILAELQHAAVGDVFPWAPTAEGGFTVLALEPERLLVLGDAAHTVTWAFALGPLDETHTRLLTRVSVSRGHALAAVLFALFWRPIHFGMQRRQLLNLKRRVEAAAPARAIG